MNNEHSSPRLTRIGFLVSAVVVLVLGCESARNEKKQVLVNAGLLGVWQNRNDDKEFMTFRPDGTMRWFYKGVPFVGIADSIVEYEYRIDDAKTPAHLDLIHRGVMGTSLLIYEVNDDDLRMGAHLQPAIRPLQFGATDRLFKRVDVEPEERQAE